MKAELKICRITKLKTRIWQKASLKGLFKNDARLVADRIAEVYEKFFLVEEKSVDDKNRIYKSKSQWNNI